MKLGRNILPVFLIACALWLGGNISYAKDPVAAKSSKTPPENQTAPDTNAPQRIFVAPDNWFSGKFTHRNNPEAVKKMQDAIDALTKFQDSGTGLVKQLQNNSDAFARVNETLDDLRARVLDNDFATGFSSKSWHWLESSFYENFGYTNAPEKRTQEVFGYQLAARLSFLKTLVDSYKALLIGQTILAGQAVTDQKLEAAAAKSPGTNAPPKDPGTNQPAGGTKAPPTTGTNPTASSSTNAPSNTNTNPVASSTFTNTPTATVTNAVTKAEENRADTNRSFTISAVLSYAQALNLAWKQSASISQNISNVPIYLDQLYSEISMREDSNYLQAASLLVPSVGTGLDDASMNVLSNHVVQLRYQVLTNFVSTFCGTNCLGELVTPKNWTNNPKLIEFSNACFAVFSEVVGTNRACTFLATHNIDQADERMLNPGPESIFLCYRPILYLAATNRNETNDLEEGILRVINTKAYTLERPTAFSAFAARDSVPKADILKEPNTARWSGESRTNKQGLLSVTNLADTIKELSKLVDEIQGLAGNVSDSSKQIAAVADILPTGKTDFFTTLTNVLFNTNLFGPSFRAGLGKPLISEKFIDTNTLQFIEKTIKDSRDYDQGQASLFKGFFTELVGFRGQIRQEDLRHMQAMSLIAAREVQRWSRLASLYQKYRKEFTDDSDRVLFTGADPAPPPNLPFPSPDKSNEWPTGWPKRPSITQSNLILPTFRLLAYSADILQKSPPTNDESGWHLIQREQRLNAAVGLVQGHFLMKTFNQRTGQDNTRLLRRELDEHKIQLHAIWSRVNESEIRLMLGDQLAFHKTGYTSEDIDAILHAAQVALIGWIGTK